MVRPSWPPEHRRSPAGECGDLVLHLGHGGLVGVLPLDIGQGPGAVGGHRVAQGAGGHHHRPGHREPRQPQQSTPASTLVAAAGGSARRRWGSPPPPGPWPEAGGEAGRCKESLLSKIGRNLQNSNKLVTKIGYEAKPPPSRGAKTEVLPSGRPLAGRVSKGSRRPAPLAGAGRKFLPPRPFTEGIFQRILNANRTTPGREPLPAGVRKRGIPCTPNLHGPCPGCAMRRGSANGRRPRNWGVPSAAVPL